MGLFNKKNQQDAEDTQTTQEVLLNQMQSAPLEYDHGTIPNLPHDYNVHAVQGQLSPQNERPNVVIPLSKEDNAFTDAMQAEAQRAAVAAAQVGFVKGKEALFTGFCFFGGLKCGC